VQSTPRLTILAILAAALALHATPASSQPSPAGWNDLVESMRTLPSALLAKLPESERNDPQIQQEAARLALEAFATSALDAIGGDGDHPAFLPASNQLLNVGQPNADTTYRSARITPGGTYRLRGRRGTDRIVFVGEFAPNLGEAGTKSTKVGAAQAYHNLNTLKTDAEGRFDVILSPQRPRGYTGDWWQLNPAANKLLLRLVASDWATEQDPTISIERLDAPITRPRPSTADLEQRLRRLSKAAPAIGLLLVDHVAELRKQGYNNKLKVFPVAQLGGLVGQSYYEGPYELADNEALIVEAKLPAKCTYRSIILTNEIYETTDWINNESSLNDSQAKPDADGILRIVVAAHDPGVPNWLDTAGYPKGLIQGRWKDCDTQPIPTIRKVPLTEIRNHLPPETPTITPQQRDQIIRTRHATFQQRPLW
jgi:hypothetical protein